MHSSVLSTLLVSLASLGYCSTETNDSSYLTTTAIVTHNDSSAFECWKFQNPLLTSSIGGIAGAKSLKFNTTTSTAYTIIPPRFDGGKHNAPVPQLVAFMSGVAHITLPDSDDQGVWVIGGAKGLIVAVDTTGSGHITTYPSDRETIALAIPFANGTAPAYEVVNKGQCEG
ncbi:hypothetical protein K461DRAFT_234334, partial [Myriangium duriaei CBS 260.36]